MIALMQFTSELNISGVGLLTIFMQENSINVIFAIIIYLVISSIDDLIVRGMQPDDVTVNILNKGEKLSQKPA